MAIRARFETDQGQVAFSRGVMTIRDPETNTVKVYIVKTEFEPRELISWSTGFLSVEVALPVGTHTFDFKVLKTPKQIRDEGLQAFATEEFARLRNVVLEMQGMEVSSEKNPGSVKARDEAVTQARGAVAAFEKKYAKYLPKPEKKTKPKGKKARKAKAKEQN